MKLAIFDLPEDTAAWPIWLEQQLVGMELGELVVQLETLYKNQSRQHQSFSEICGSQMSELLQRGLSSLSTRQISALFQNPAAILELQEHVLAGGGSYWDNVPLSGTDRDAVHRVTSRACQAVSDTTDRAPKAQLNTANNATQNTWFSRNAIATLTALAATVLLVLGIWSQTGDRPSGWGFDQPGLLAQDVSARTYLSNLSDAAGQWSKKKPSNARELEKRLAEFRHGCDTLIAAPHKPLEEVDRQWLIGKCKAWAGEIDSYLAELSRDAGSFSDVNLKADETISRLKNALKDRALNLKS
jgi:hypothetical protein